MKGEAGEVVEVRCEVESNPPATIMVGEGGGEGGEEQGWNENPCHQ